MQKRIKVGDRIRDLTTTPKKLHKKLKDDYNKTILNARVDAVKQILKIWKFVVIFNTLATMCIVLLTGFKVLGFYIDNQTFVTTIISLTISSFILGSATKLLKIEK